MNKHVFISTHAVFNDKGVPLYGTGSSIEEYLKENEIEYTVIKFPLAGNALALIQSYKEHILTNEKKRYFLSMFPLRFVQEFFFVYKEFMNKRNNSLFIGINPLNATYGVMLKKMGLVKQVIFYTADYADKRYDNFILDWLYHKLDTLALTHADKVWNISLRIYDVRTKQGVKNKRNVLVPNAPLFNGAKIIDSNKINKHTLVVVSSSNAAVNFSLVFEAIEELKKKYPTIHVIIIGYGNYTKAFSTQMKKLGIIKHVYFYSSLPHEQLNTILRKSAIGLALYTNMSPWTYYADSMKVRDYLACGLPVIMTNAMGTAADITKYNAGYVIPMEKDALVKSIDSMFSNKKRYNTLRNNAIALARKSDINKILDSALRFYLHV